MKLVNHHFGCREEARLFFFFFFGPLLLLLPPPLAELLLWSTELLDFVAAVRSATAFRLHRRGRVSITPQEKHFART